MKSFTRYSVGAILALALVYAAFTAIRFAGQRTACGTEERLKVVELSDIRFEVTYLSCDTLAKDEAIRVYAETRASDGAWFFPKWRKQRTLLFRYDPGRPDSQLPSITRPTQSTILISVPDVSSISYQKQKWANMSVRYNIGHIDYPATSK